MNQLRYLIFPILLTLVNSCSSLKTTTITTTNNQIVTTKKNVLLIHGILMNPLEMKYLGKQLDNAGFKVHYVYYHSVLKTPAQNAQSIHKKIKQLNLPDLHIVAHSLGGMITMHLFDQFDDIPKGKVVMLGAPVNGSWIAQQIQDWPVISPLLARSMPSALSGENIPDWKNKRDWGMIAGTKNQGLGLLTGGLPNEGDGTVMLEETHHSKQTAHTTVKRSHTGLLFSKEVATLTANFLKTGKFQ
jgi:pimeloyl-ACP methyl ester carboxylesterase